MLAFSLLIGYLPLTIRFIPIVLTKIYTGITHFNIPAIVIKTSHLIPMWQQMFYWNRSGIFRSFFYYLPVRKSWFYFPGNGILLGNYKQRFITIGNVYSNNRRYNSIYSIYRHRKIRIEQYAGLSLNMNTIKRQYHIHPQILAQFPYFLIGQNDINPWHFILCPEYRITDNDLIEIIHIGNILCQSFGCHFTIAFQFAAQYFMIIFSFQYRHIVYHSHFSHSIWKTDIGCL